MGRTLSLEMYEEACHSMRYYNLKYLTTIRSDFQCDSPQPAAVSVDGAVVGSDAIYTYRTVVAFRFFRHKHHHRHLHRCENPRSHAPV